MRTSDDVTGPMNLGNPVEFTMRELANLVLELTGSRSHLEFLPLPIDDPTQRQPDIGYAKAVLGWQPRTQLRDGLARTVDYFESMLVSGRELAAQ